MPADDRPVVRSGDIVYLDRCKGPFKCYRVGYGFFDGEIRVARLREDTSVWQNGMWVRASWCCLLEAGDTLEALDDIVDAFGDPDQISKGTRCRFLGQESDGDFRLHVGGRRTTVFLSDLESLDLI